MKHTFLHCALVGASAFATVALFAPVRAHSQTLQPVTCPAQQQALLVMPEIKSGADHKLRGTVKLVDGVRTLWGFTGDARCATQNLRILQGVDANNPKPWPVTTDPMPGPTLRARVGDLVELTFFNQIDVNNFANSLDHGAIGTMDACDQYTFGGSTASSGGGDTMPNCLHGSSTSNLHFHGTHTTPSTTGDNVVMFIRPSLRANGKVLPSDSTANAAFAPLFAQCEESGPPKTWTATPTAMQNLQQSLIQLYDTTVAYQGKPGTLPDSMQLWPANEKQISQGLWPQYQIGAYPYCFPLPAYDSTTMRMGQSPGTHWYHAHKHGSTALNVANGLTGAFIIEGKYDDDLHKYYGANLTQQVLMIQQLASAPFPLTDPTVSVVTGHGPGAPRPQISVNGRLDPVVTMHPGEVQLWRIINGAFRDAVQFIYFEPQSKTSCANVKPAVPSPVQWRQIAQDGVQFNVANYDSVGTLNSAFNLAPANRADLLVQAPAQSGMYTLCIVKNSALYVQSTTGLPDAPSPLLTVNVAAAAKKAKSATAPYATGGFIPDSLFPTFPVFLKDVVDSEIRKTRTLTFGAGNSTIDGISFEDGVVNQAMLLNTAEEWTIKNEADDKSHPFHIHINPFQITTLFEPNAPEAKDKTNPCYVDPNNPDTWKPCATRQPAAPWIWWDTFAIPTAQQISLACTTLSACPTQLQPYTKCTSRGCTEYIDGWFRMRTRFVDFTGQYVLHCHILIHEDRGMMQLIEVVPNTTPYTHH